jgi:dGTPase
MENYFNFTQSEKNYLKQIQIENEQQLSPYATKDVNAIRKYNSNYNEMYYRQEFGVDVDKILHNALYNRYVDKTQVFSFYRNDDITRRALHVQLVARIALLIGRALRLNIDLIEAIALGHDIGHTPFGHKGEEFLNKLYFGKTNRYFNHNVHSVRVLKKITQSNLCLQTYDGILSHCGEKCFRKYYPNKLVNFEDFDKIYEKCYIEKDYIKELRPSTLEGCVVRISDMIAYVGKDRQDASKAGLLKMNIIPEDKLLGSSNTEIINKMITNIIKNSIGKEYLSMDQEVFEHFESMQQLNYKMIYNDEKVKKPYYDIIEPMMMKLYNTLLSGIKDNNFDSPVYKHHLNHNILGNYYRESKTRKIIAEPNDVVVDYIASMTDDYFLDLFKYMFKDDPLNNHVKYVEYFS